MKTEKIKRYFRYLWYALRGKQIFPSYNNENGNRGKTLAHEA